MILLLIFVVTFFDQLTKWLICKNFGIHDFCDVIPGFFSLRKVFNVGAAWGMLSGQRLFLIIVSVAMLTLLWHNRREFIESGKLCQVSIGLLTGGIIGNLIDRLKFGYVVDFLDFHWGTVYTFPTFNVADSSIFIGIVLFFLHTLFSKKRS